jgi:hypothetical protein
MTACCMNIGVLNHLKTPVITDALMSIQLVSSFITKNDQKYRS